MMHLGSYLINTASAALVDEAALVDALRSGAFGLAPAWTSSRRTP